MKSINYRFKQLESHPPGYSPVHMPSSIQSKSHLLFVDSLRAIAAIYVVMHHATLQYFENDNLAGFKRISIELFHYGHFAVDLFIVLSGYSLMLSVTRNNYQLKGGTLAFLKRRIIRILPPYYFAMLLSLVLIWTLIGKNTGTHWDASLPVTSEGVLTHIFLIQDFFDSTLAKINHSFWSISVEFRIYLLFPLLVWVWRKAGAWYSLLAAFLIAAAGLFLLMRLRSNNNGIDLNFSGVTPYIILFSCGMLAADLAFSKTKNAVYIRMLYSSMFLRAFVISVVVYLVSFEFIRLLIKLPFLLEKATHRNLLLDMNDIFIGILSAFVLFLCSLPRTAKKPFWIVKILNWNPLVFMGTFSYSLYLIHAPLLQIITQYILMAIKTSDYIRCFILILVGTPLIILMSYLFFLLFERPFLTPVKQQPLNNVEATEIETVNNPAP